MENKFYLHFKYSWLFLDACFIGPSKPSNPDLVNVVHRT